MLDAANFLEELNKVTPESLQYRALVDAAWSQPPNLLWTTSGQDPAFLCAALSSDAPPETKDSEFSGIRNILCNNGLSRAGMEHAGTARHRRSPQGEGVRE